MQGKSRGGGSWDRIALCQFGSSSGHRPTCTLAPNFHCARVVSAALCPDRAARLADIPGVSTVAAAELLAEIGVDMTRFPSAAHLVSWAKFCPQIHQSAGKSISKGRAKL